MPASARDPHLSFWYYGVDGATDRLDIMVADNATGVFTKLGSRTLDQEGTGWHRVVLPLSDYKGSTVRIGFYGVCTTYTALILIDNIRVTEMLDGNLALTALTAPARANAGTVADFTVSIENRGLTDMNNVEISLECDGEKVGSATVKKIEADRSAEASLNHLIPVFSADRLTYTATLTCQGDTYADDNTSLPATVKISVPALPRVTDLAGTAQEGHVALEWSAPQGGQEATEMLESFEDGEAFAIDTLEGWTFIDRDGKTTFGIEGATFPNNGKPMAYMVIDCRDKAFAGEFTPRSGNQSLASFNADDSGANDNWAISPLLSGKPQTVQFAAKSHTTAYGYEAFEVLYSTTGTAPDNFVKLFEDKRVGAEWKDYTFDVPQGAKYFAIRCVSEDAFVFLVDDVVFTPAALPEVSKPLGYYVFRDGEMLTDTNFVTSTSYAENPGDTEAHTYHVSACYAQGLSAPSNEVRISASVLSELQAGNPTVYAEAGRLIGANVAGVHVTVAAADGKLLYDAVPQADGPICDAAAGIYLVKAGTRTFKVLVP